MPWDKRRRCDLPLLQGDYIGEGGGYTSVNFLKITFQYLTLNIMYLGADSRARGHRHGHGHGNSSSSSIGVRGDDGGGRGDSGSREADPSAREEHPVARCGVRSATRAMPQTINFKPLPLHKSS